MQVIARKQKLEVLEGCHNSALGGGQFGRDKTLKKLLNDSIGLALLTTLKNFVALVTSAKELTGTYNSCSWIAFS